MARIIEVCRIFVERFVALPSLGSADLVDDLVMEDAKEPGPFGAIASKILRGPDGGEQGLLDGVLRILAAEELGGRQPEQIGPVGVDPAIAIGGRRFHGGV